LQLTLPSGGSTPTTALFVQAIFASNVGATRLNLALGRATLSSSAQEGWYTIEVIFL
jgi:hypothetical protein